MNKTGKTDLQPVEILSSYRQIVKEVIFSKLISPEFPKQFAIPDKYKDEEKFHWELASDYPNRVSKYLRPTVILLVTEAMGVKADLALPTAAAMQVSEEWLLIHDDFEDNSPLRRGLPSLHLQYSSELAINAGDSLHILMWEFLRENIKLLGSDKADQIYEEFFKMLSRTAIGQTTEIRWTQDNRMEFSDEDWFFVCDGKTSYYTMAGPMRLGAILGGATPAQLESITRFGLVLGRCFQLVDDLLDLTSDFGGKKLEKNDLYEGKRTLILGHLLRSLSPTEKQKVQKILAKSREKKTEAEIILIYELMVKKGSLDYAKKMAKDFRDQAMNILKNELSFLAAEPARTYLMTLTDFILNRDH